VAGVLVADGDDMSVVVRRIRADIEHAALKHPTIYGIIAQQMIGLI
jgi:hypothetical protein